ncbi:tetratricopeptide repeat protein [Streptomyces europaeiscabiei]|uniref:tetratricopeptide repeat protein n=1 Tax=Streptomyces europaeiscabiei TaxID=146819 RepID=UPI0029BC5482|nr:tetratricopeptide repeat protein [Streptomyces europaeiscabiei]MDX3866433.1 tetratricopeptide repeat protein [Streptomyces europaeiscabiei]MDX3873045.1 tetratricopeptide repeat protein [Streptomyces europaeiscabiei]
MGVVFVHGFLSSPAVWKNFEKLIDSDSDLSFVTTLPFEYASPKLRINPLLRIPDVNDIAGSLQSYLEVEAAGYDQLVLVSHSQGGLVVQRYLAQMLARGKGLELGRIRGIVFFSCPNDGSELFLSLRRRWLPRNPQENGLRPLNREVKETQSAVINQVVHARAPELRACPIPIRAYAGASDNVVTRTSAQSVFPDIGVLPGDHSSIIQPDSLTHRSYTALKHRLLEFRSGTRQAPSGSATSSPEAGFEVGVGESGLHRAFQDLFAAVGGTAVLGFPSSDVHRYGPVLLQIFERPGVSESMVICVRPGSSAMAMPGSVWEALRTACGGNTDDGIDLVGLPIVASSSAVEQRVVDEQTCDVAVGGGEWGKGRIRRESTGAAWRWEPVPAKTCEQTRSADYWTAGLEKPQLRLRVVATLPWADRSDLEITPERHRNLAAALPGSSLTGVVAKLFGRRGVALPPVDWKRGSNGNDLNRASYEHVVMDPEGQPALVAEVMLSVGHDTLVTCTEVRIESAEAWRTVLMPATGSHHDALLDWNEVEQVLYSAWSVATELLPKAAHQDPAALPWAGVPTVELRLSAEHRHDSPSPHPVLKDLIDLAPLGPTDRDDLARMSVTVTAPPRMKAGDRYELLLSTLEFMYQQFGYIDVPPTERKSLSEEPDGLSETPHSAGPVTLPTGPSAFTGRAKMLGRLLDSLDPDSAQTEASTVASVVTGMGGIGKTALALHAAHRASERGWFPSGVLFADLHGYSPAAGGAGAVVDRFLHVLGVNTGELPATSEERLDTWRVLLNDLARRGRPLLVVLDNVRTTDQINDLLPAAPHRALVTSRHTLSTLSAHRFDLAPLSPEEAVDLLDQALRAGGAADGRVTTQRAEALRLGELCGRLPLALRIIAALLRDDPERSLADQARDLEDARTRLDAMQYDDLAVRASLDLSYQHLTEEQARALRLLATAPGADIATASAAVLLDRSAADGRRLLAELARAHLLSSTSERWSMHDLIRLYADNRSTSDEHHIERVEGIERLYSHYLASAQDASGHLDTRQLPQPPSVFADRDAALDWLEGERTNLVATVASAHALSVDAVAVGLAFALAAFFEGHRYVDQHRHFADWSTVTSIALAILQAVGDRHNEAKLMTNLGVAQRELRQFDVSITLLRTAIDTFAESGDRSAQAKALDMLGAALRETGQFDECIRCHTEAVTVFREIRDHHGEARALTNLGAVLREARQPGTALLYLRKAVGLMRTMGDRRGEATALTNLGAVLCGEGQPEEAIARHEEALAAFREVRDPYGEALALHNHGDGLQQVGRFTEAIDDHARAAAFFAGVGDSHHQAMALSSLAAAYSGAEHDDEAADVSHQAVKIRRQLVETAPVVNAPELARTLCLAAWVRRNGQLDLPWALLAAEEGARIYRDLAAGAPTVFNPQFKMALELQADLLDRLGRTQQAEVVRRESPFQTPGSGT